VAILAELIKFIRAGELPFGSGKVPNPKALVLVGHSFGSVITNGLLSTNPDIADAAIIT
jgi:alpha/beta superfamily hydrolase